MGAKEYSADPKAPNFLKKVKPELRQSTKAWALGFAYGMSEFKLAKMLKIEPEEAAIYKKKYFAAFGNLLKYHKKCEFTLGVKGGVSNIMGRLRRAELVPMLYKQGLRSFSYNDIRKNYARISKLVPDMELGEIASACSNEIRNSYNFPIQSLAASVVNHACINFQNRARSLGLQARLCCQEHDQITVLCPKNEVEVVSKLLKEAMENNIAANKVWVPMKADPVVVSRWSEAK
jgi:DNA polymerase-1